MKKYIIYIHKNKTNGKVYVGQTCQPPSERWRKGQGYRSSTKFFHAIEKYGWDGFEHIILEEDLSETEADDRERYWISYYDSVENGYNLSYGGNDLHNFSKEHKKNLQESIKKALGKPVICLNTLKIYETIAEAKLDTGAEHIGDCCKRKVLTAGKDKNGKGLVWRYLDEYDPNEKINIKQQKRSKTKVLCVETNIIYESAKEAERQTGIDSTSIGRCCSGIRYTAGKCHWKWVE